MADVSKTEYALRRKELLSLVKQLRAVGAQGDLDLPRITVIGNQSAGKSSVVEAISGINVPRDAGTCTRCPMECRLSSSNGPWSCRISLRLEFEPNGRPRDTISEIPFGNIITDKHDVELLLRKAQTAILNPTMLHRTILNMKIKELKEIDTKETLPFSRNVVCVDLEGPDLTDLSFIDLPGIIQNAEPEIVQLVESMVVSHIEGNCLILVALPMTDDIENQKAIQLARQADPQGRRTIGVMTKPDMLPSGAIQALNLWLDVIEGRRHPLTHGYYCTRQPDDSQRAAMITSSQARLAETEFFKKTMPWAGSVNRERFGTDNLIATLSGLLIQIINDGLPKLRLDTMAALESCTSELSRLPRAIDMEPATYMLSIVTGLCSEVQQFVRGSVDLGQLIHENRTAFSDFKRAIRGTAPTFVPLLDIRQGVSSKVIEELGSGKPVYLKDVRAHIEKSVTRELPKNVPFQAKVSLIRSFQQTWRDSTLSCFDQVRDTTIRILMDLVDARFERYDRLRRDLRLFITDLVKTHYASCLESLEEIIEVEETPFTQNTHYLETCTEKWLAKYKAVRAGKMDLPSAVQPTLGVSASTPSLFASSQSPAFGVPSFSQPRATEKDKTTTPVPFWERNTGTPTSAAAAVPNTETAPPVVGFGGFSRAPNPSASGTGIQATTPIVPSPSIVPPAPLPFSFSAAAARPTPAPDQEKINLALAALAELGYRGLTAEDLGKLNPSDEYETELEVMAQVRGYFQVAYKRMIDNVPSLIDLKLVKAVAKTMQPFLIEKLGLGTVSGSARCAAYLAEDPNIVARREELVARKRRLESVDTELCNFGL